VLLSKVYQSLVDSESSGTQVQAVNLVRAASRGKPFWYAEAISGKLVVMAGNHPPVTVCIHRVSHPPVNLGQGCGAMPRDFALRIETANQIRAPVQRANGIVTPEGKPSSIASR